MLLADSLRYQVTRQSAAVAIIDDASIWTFSEVFTRAVRGMQKLLAWDSEHSRLAMLVGNKAEHLILLYSIAATNHEVLVLDPSWSRTEITRAITTFKPQLFVHDAEFAVVNATDLGVETLSIDALFSDGGTVIGGRTIEPVDEEYYSRAKRSAAFLVSPSGGSSGRMKASLISHGATVDRFLTQQVEFGVFPGDRFLVATPLFHGSARSHSLGHLYFGGSVRILQKFDPHVFIREGRNATATFCVPTMIQRLFDLEDIWLPQLKLIAGGAVVSQQLGEDILAKITPHAYVYYASVESGPIALKKIKTEQLSHQQQPQGDVGHSVFGAQVTIIDADEQGIGQICVSADFLSSSLEGDIDTEIDRLLREDKLYKTGDLGQLGPDGRLFVLGRADDVVISGGVNIHPKEVEQVLKQVFQNLQCVVLGVPDQAWGEKLVAACIHTGPATITYSDFKRALEPHLSKAKIPKELHWIESVPMTSLGKVDIRTLKHLIIERGDHENH